MLSVLWFGLSATAIAGNVANAANTAPLKNRVETTSSKSDSTEKNSEKVAKQAAEKAEAAAQEIKGRPHQDMRARGRLEKTSDRVDRAIEKADKS